MIFESSDISSLLLDSNCASAKAIAFLKFPNLKFKSAW